MRAAVIGLLILAGGCASTPAPAPLPPAPARMLPAPPIATQNARVEVRQGNDLVLWVDVGISGDERRAAQICQWAIADRLRLENALPETRVASTCAAAALRPLVARPGSYLLVVAEDVTEDDFTLEIATNRDTSLWLTGISASGSVTTYSRISTRATCEQAVADGMKIRAENDVDVAQRTNEFLRTQLATAREREQRECEAARAAVSACPAKKKAERPSCQDPADATAERCEQLRAQSAIIENRLQHPKALPPQTPPVCRAE